MEILKDTFLILPEITTALAVLVALLLDVVVEREKWIIAAFALFSTIVVGLMVYFNLFNSGEAFKMLAITPLARAFDLVIILGAFITLLIGWERRSEFHILLLSAVLGAMVLVKSVHFISFILALEIFSFALIGQMAITWDKRGVEAAMKFFLLSVLASTLIVMGMTLVYGVYGTMHFPTIYRSDVYEIKSLSDSLLFLTAFAMIIAGMGFKLSAVPFHFWTPEVFRGTHSALGGFIATVSKAAAFGFLVNLLLEAFARQYAVWGDLMIWLAVITMTVGNLAALAEKNIKRMLGFSTISHAGYVLLAFGVGTEESIGAAVFYLVVYTLMTLGAFAVVHSVGEEGSDLAHYKGLLKRAPFQTAFLAVFMLSLAGLPPTAGFVGKFYLFSSVLKEGYMGFVLWALLNGVISLFYYVRPVFYALGFAPQVSVVPRLKPSVFFAMVIAFAGVVYFGLAPSGLLEFMRTLLGL